MRTTRTSCGSPAGAAAASPLSACGGEDRAGPRRGRILLAYFSRPGENYWYGGRRNLEVGNTEVLARMIRARLDCDVHRIEAADPYPDDYEATVAAQRARAGRGRPARRSPTRCARSTRYDTILLASPIWNVRAPMIMTTFAERYDFAGKTVLPVTTHAMSGLGNTPDDYAESCRGARIGTGLAVRGEKVRSAARTSTPGCVGPASARRLNRSEPPVSSSISCVFPRGANAMPTTPDTINIPARNSDCCPIPAPMPDSTTLISAVTKLTSGADRQADSSRSYW